MIERCAPDRALIIRRSRYDLSAKCVAAPRELSHSLARSDLRTCCRRELPHLNSGSQTLQALPLILTAVPHPELWRRIVYADQTGRTTRRSWYPHRPWSATRCGALFFFRDEHDQYDPAGRDHRGAATAARGVCLHIGVLPRRGMGPGRGARRTHDRRPARVGTQFRIDMRRASRCTTPWWSGAEPAPAHDGRLKAFTRGRRSSSTGPPMARESATSPPSTSLHHWPASRSCSRESWIASAGAPWPA